MYRVFVGEMLNLHRGQGRDILWRDTARCPTEEEYYDMVLDKTGGLFRLAVRLMQAVSPDERGRSVNFIPLVNKLTLYFQIRDDYCNLASTNYALNKSFCEDLTEGKLNL
jgi:geranylgeranyl diphosphate synthase type 3